MPLPINQRFGRLTIVGLAPPKISLQGCKIRNVFARCDCGQTVTSIALGRGHVAAIRSIFEMYILSMALLNSGSWEFACQNAA
jgi:hypothetical protein